MKLSFLGAMNFVGSSGILVETGSERFVLDYGTDLQDTPPSFPAKVKGKVDAVFLSHAHLDHSGGLPIMVKKNRCPVFAGAPGKGMVRMLLNDSLKIARNEGIDLPFRRHDVETTVKSFKHIKYRKTINVGKSMFTGYNAGHIPGSMMSFIETPKGGKHWTLLYTGDFNTKDTRLVKGADTDLPDIDVLVTESTYADREHPDRKRQEKLLIKTVQSTLANDGIALLSSFAIGRTQEVLLILADYGIDYPLYMDGMAKKATTIINGCPKSIKDETSLDKALRKVKYITNRNQRKKAIKNPCVIMTTSGMLNGGPVVSYIKNLHEDRRNSLVLTGYQVEDTPGRILMETGRFFYESNDMKKHELKIKMGVTRLDFSSHTGRKDLFSFIKNANPKKVFCVHGDNIPKFAQELRDRGFDTVAPVPGKATFDLN
jgi:putative mRNA 3-end processing factor